MLGSLRSCRDRNRCAVADAGLSQRLLAALLTWMQDRGSSPRRSGELGFASVQFR